MSAIANDSDGPHELIKVLFALHDGVDSLAFTGPLSVLTAAYHNPKDTTTEAFDISFCGPSSSKPLMTKQGLLVLPQLSYKEAHASLKDYDMLVVPSGAHIESMVKQDAEPIGLIKAYAAVQEADPGRERTLFSIDTGSHLLAKAGALKGFAATTHPDSYIALELLGQQASAYESTDRTDVMDDRYIVNNARFDLGDISENPFVIGKAEAEVMSKKDRRRSSTARKGSFALRESNMKGFGSETRAGRRLGGMRVVTSGGSASGSDAALYLVAALVSVEAAEEAARRLQFNWTKGVVVNSIDV